MKTPEELLEAGETYLREVVGPMANQIDSDMEALKVAFKGLCDLELMALRRPKEFGGPEFTERQFRQHQETVARYSGSLAFLQTQHQSAGTLIAKGDNDRIRSEYLPKMANGEKLVGIGFSQLRRPGEPILKAVKTDEGYRLTGLVPWVTGLGIMHEFMIGAALDDGRAVFGPVPFVDTELDGGSIKFGEVMELAAMESPQTVQAHLDNYLLREEDVVIIRPAGWIQNNDMINVLLQGFFALGCARGGLDIVLQAYERKQAAFIKTAWDKLDAELMECRELMISGGGDVEDRLQVRAWAIDLAARCAHAGVASSSGAANSVKHNAQRVYREALVFTVSAQTAPIMEATLNRLTARSQPVG
jgi:alkylation response protein AidB-like acyl-CoA dehydrogenase